MEPVRIAAVVFALAAAGVAGFQVALALGAPWGRYAMGGGMPGRFPTPLRIASAFQALVVALLAVVVLSAGRVADPGLVDALPALAWIPVAFSVVAVVLNAITRSAGERRLWLPVALVLLLSSVIVALGR
jgi:hypothetical protein